MNPQHIESGPGKVTFRGITVASGDIDLGFAANPVSVATVQHGADANRFEAAPTITVTFPPVCAWATVEPLYDLLASYPLGGVIGPKSIGIASINTGTEVWTTASAHGLATADPVHFARGAATWPTLSSGALDAETTYYVRQLSSTTFSVHPTANDATNNTNALNVTAYDAATGGTVYVVIDEPCVVHFASGAKYTLHNAQLTGVPNLQLGANVPWANGNFVLRALIKTGAAVNTDAAYYTRAFAAYSAPDSVETLRVAIPVTVDWDNGAPWNAMLSETPVTVAFNIALADVPAARVGGAGALRLTDLKVDISLKPQNVSTADLATFLKLQTSTGGAGTPLAAYQMDLTGTDGSNAFSFQVTKMTLDAATLKASLSEQTVQPLTFRSARTSGTHFTAGA